MSIWNNNARRKTTSNEQNPTYIYKNVGTYTATLTVYDSKGATATDTAEVIVHEVDELLDWLIDKQRHGWPMVNSMMMKLA